jgi:hypothetical protein
VCSVCALRINKNDSELYCVHCYGEARCIPTDTAVEELTEYVSRNEMLRSLAAIGHRITDSTNVDNDAIEDIYETVIINKQTIYDETLGNRVPFPKEQSTYLEKSVSKVCVFNIKDGGRYMKNQQMTTQQKISLTKLLTELTTVPKPNPNEDKVYRVISPIVRKFADGSRVKTGTRLCKRSCRHGTDPKAVDIRLSSGHVIEYEDEIGICLQHMVRASMKSAIYKVKVAFTYSNLVACSCNCKAGSFGLARIVCVHILPILFQIGQLLHYCMSEHILVELTNFYTHDIHLINNDVALVKAIYILIRSEQGHEPDTNIPIEQLLLK